MTSATSHAVHNNSNAHSGNTNSNERRTSHGQAKEGKGTESGREREGKQSGSVTSRPTSATDSSCSSTSSSARQKDGVIFRRLLTIALTDFLCYFPMGLCGVLAEAGVSVPSEVNVALAIVVLPLNSAINPFLYTLNAFRDRQRRAQEQRIRELLAAQLTRV